MTENIRARMFLTSSEKESLWELVDSLEAADLEDQEMDEKRHEWLEILLSLLLGKKGIPPLYIKGTIRRPGESSD